MNCFLKRCKSWVAAVGESLPMDTGIKVERGDKAQDQGKID